MMNAIYDLIAQNNIEQEDKDHLTALVDHVDTERNAIVFRNSEGKEFELQLVNTFAPAPERQEV